MKQRRIKLDERLRSSLARISRKIRKKYASLPGEEARRRFSRARALEMYLRRSRDDHGEFQPTIAQILQETGLSRATLGRMIPALQKYQRSQPDGHSPWHGGSKRLKFLELVICGSRRGGRRQHRSIIPQPLIEKLQCKIAELQHEQGPYVLRAQTWLKKTHKIEITLGGLHSFIYRRRRVASGMLSKRPKKLVKQTNPFL